MPIIGEIAAGGPIEAYQDATETMAVPDILAPGGDAYVLRVRGDSMIEAHIADGDFVLIRPQTTARNGDIVVAQVEENAVTLKRFFKEKDQIRLQPANPAYPAAVLRRRAHPGQAHRRHPTPRLRAAAGRPMRALAGSAVRSRTAVRSLSCSPPAFASNRPARRFSIRRAMTRLAQAGGYPQESSTSR